MNFEQLVIQLIYAINNKDLENTKKYVKAINNYSEPYSITELSKMLSLGYWNPVYEDYLHNECIDYVLLNINKINSAEEILLIRKRDQLIESKNLIEIENFIQQQLQQSTYNVNNKIFTQVLIELSINLKNKEKTFYYLKQIEEVM